MSPAFEAAMATMVPTVRTAARAPPSIQPAAANAEATPSRVTRAMPEVGCDDTPTMPTMRAATATKSTPKIATPEAQTARWVRSMPPAKTPGTSHETVTTSAIPPKTKPPGRSRSVSGTPAADPVPLTALAALAAAFFFSPRATAVNEAIMVGKLRTTVRMPAVATAPAPM